MYFNPSSMQTIFIIFALFMGFIMIRYNFAFFDLIGRLNEFVSELINKKIYEQNKKKENAKAFEYAKIYISIAKNNNYILSNKHCQVIFDKKAEIIQIIDSSDYTHIVTASDFFVIDINKIWNNLCFKFNNNTKIIDVVEQLKCVAKNISENQKSKKKIDINNCNKKDLLNLPGINNAIATRIIKYRESNGSFNSISDFFKQFKIKEHFQRQLITLMESKEIEVKIINENIQINPQNNAEREIDF